MIFSRSVRWKVAPKHLEAGIYASLAYACAAAARGGLGSRSITYPIAP